MPTRKKPVGEIEDMPKDKDTAVAKNEDKHEDAGNSKAKAAGKDVKKTAKAKAVSKQKPTVATDASKKPKAQTETRATKPKEQTEARAPSAKKAGTKTTGKTVDKSAGKTASKATTSKTAGKTTGKTVDKTVGKTASKTTDKAATSKTTGKPVSKAATNKTTGKTTGKATNKTAGKTTGKATSKAAGKTTSKAASGTSVSKATASKKKSGKAKAKPVNTAAKEDIIEPEIQIPDPAAASSDFADIDETVGPVKRALPELGDISPALNDTSREFLMPKNGIIGRIKASFGFEDKKAAASSAPPEPESKPQSRRFLLPTVVCLLLVVIVAAVIGIRMLPQQQNGTPSDQSTADTEGAASRPVSIPHLSALLGVSLDEAQELLKEDFEIYSSESRQSAESEASANQGVTDVIVLRHFADNEVPGFAAVTLGLDATGFVITAEFSCPMDAFGLSDRPFDDAIGDTEFIEQSLNSVGIQPKATDLVLPSGGADKIYETSGDPSSRLIQESCDFIGKGADGATGWWVVSITYNYGYDDGADTVSKTLRIRLL